MRTLDLGKLHGVEMCAYFCRASTQINCHSHAARKCQKRSNLLTHTHLQAANTRRCAIAIIYSVSHYARVCATFCNFALKYEGFGTSAQRQLAMLYHCRRLQNPQPAVTSITKSCTPASKKCALINYWYISSISSYLPDILYGSARHPCYTSCLQEKSV